MKNCHPPVGPRDPILRVQTIEHTGTVFLLNTLQNAGIGRNRIDFTHLNPERTIRVMNVDRPVLTTVRNPYRVAATWANRSDWMGDMNETAFLQRWFSWREFVLPRADVVVSVDLEDREERFVRASEIVGKKLKPDFDKRENASPDRLGVQAALDNGDMAHYFSHVSPPMMAGIQKILEKTEYGCSRWGH